MSGEIEWARLEPQRPLRTEWMAERYAGARPSGAGARLARELEALGLPTAIVGPPGVGKSTELAQAHIEMTRKGLANAPVLADHTPEAGVFKELHSYGSVSRVAVGAVQQTLLFMACEFDSERWKKRFEVPAQDWPTNRTRALDLLDEVKRITKRDRVFISIDGLERQPVGELPEVVEQLVELHERSAKTFVPAFVLPAAFSVNAYAAELLGKARVFAIEPVAVRDHEGLEAAPGVTFLLEVARRTLALSDGQLVEHRLLFERAARFSGGVPRTFLQLLQMASTYARLEDSVTVHASHLAQAERELTNSFVRLLQKGDVDALREASGTEGLEVEQERKLRFLSTGVLLSYERADDVPIVFPAPALEPVLRVRKAA